MEPIDDWAARYAVLEEQLKDHPGSAAFFRWERVKMAHAALLWNEHALITHTDLGSEEGQERAMGMFGDSPEARAAMQSYWLFFFLHLANFTAMNATLIDHVRGLMAEYRGTKFAAAEQERRKAVGSAPVTVFIKDLRNYIAHITTPPLLVRLSFTQEDGSAVIAGLDVAQLLESRRFTAPSRAYLGDATSVDVHAAVTEYRQVREAYYEWLFEQFQTLHGGAVADHDRLVELQQQMRAEAEAKNAESH